MKGGMENGDGSQDGKGEVTPKRDWRKGGFLDAMEQDPSAIAGWKQMRQSEFWKTASKTPEKGQIAVAKPEKSGSTQETGIDEGKVHGAILKESSADLSDATASPSTSAQLEQKPSPSKKPSEIASGSKGGNVRSVEEGLQEKVNYLMEMVGSLTSEVRHLKKQKSQPEVTPQQPSSSADPQDEMILEVNSSEMEEEVVDPPLASVPIPTREQSSTDSNSKKCFICLEQGSSSLADKRLDGVFIMKELFRLPPPSLDKYLEKLAEKNADSLISLCGECEEMVREAGESFEEIQNATRNFQRIQEEVVRKLKQSKEKSGGEGQLVMECDNAVPEPDPVPQGEIQAGRILRSRPSRSKTPMVPANDPDDSELEGVSEDDWEPPSSNAEDQISPESEHDSDNGLKSQESESLTTRTRKRLKDDEFVHEDDKIRFRCPVESCSKVYISKRSYKQHKLQHLKQGPLIKPKKRTQTKRRAASKNGQPARKCPQCQFPFYYSHTLARHIKRVHGEEYDFHCEVCGKGETSRTDMRYHQAMVHGMCTVDGCNKKFPGIRGGDRKALRNHQVEHHGKEYDMFACPDCDHISGKVTNLRVHRHKCHLSNGRSGNAE